MICNTPLSSNREVARLSGAKPDVLRMNERPCLPLCSLTCASRSPPLTLKPELAPSSPDVTHTQSLPDEFGLHGRGLEEYALLSRQGVARLRPKRIGARFPTRNGPCVTIKSCSLPIRCTICKQPPSHSFLFILLMSDCQFLHHHHILGLVCDDSRFHLSLCELEHLDPEAFYSNPAAIQHNYIEGRRQQR